MDPVHVRIGRRPCWNAYLLSIDRLGWATLFVVFEENVRAIQGSMSIMDVGPRHWHRPGQCPE